jgi:ribosomal protein L28
LGGEVTHAAHLTRRKRLINVVEISTTSATLTPWKRCQLSI